MAAGGRRERCARPAWSMQRPISACFQACWHVSVRQVYRDDQGACAGHQVQGRRLHGAQQLCGLRRQGEIRGSHRLSAQPARSLVALGLLVDDLVNGNGHLRQQHRHSGQGGARGREARMSRRQREERAARGAGAAQQGEAPRGASRACAAHRDEEGGVGSGRGLDAVDLAGRQAGRKSRAGQHTCRPAWGGSGVRDEQLGACLDGPTHSCSCSCTASHPTR